MTHEITELERVRAMILEMEEAANCEPSEWMSKQKDWLACHKWLYAWAKTGEMLW